jgi:hypothetical protein
MIAKIKGLTGPFEEAEGFVDVAIPNIDKSNHPRGE